MICTDQDIGSLIGGYELGLLTDEEKRQFENHLLECEYCFQSLHENAPIADLIREEKLAPSKNVNLQIDIDGEPVRLIQRKWVYAAATVLAVTILAFFLKWLQSPEEKNELLRGHDDVSILALSPVGEVTTVDELRWKPVSGVDSYDVKIFTETNDLVWEGSVSEKKIALPDTIKENLARGHTYFWQVEAQTAKGDRLKSQMVRFQIRD